MTEAEQGRPRVVILYRYVPRYRAAFYRRLRSSLDGHGVRLELVYGQPIEEDAAKEDAAEIEWGTKITNRTLGRPRRQLVWQPALRVLAGADLVIVEQATKLLVHPILLLWSRLGGPAVAVWGHGINLQSDGSTWSQAGEWLKRWHTRSAHWMFAYTEESMRLAVTNGMDASRVTVVRNTNDDGELASALLALTDADLDRWRSEHGIGAGPLGLYLGGLYQEKRLDVLLETAARIRGRLPGFELVVGGRGPQVEQVARAAEQQTWVHYLGPVYGPDKAAAFATAGVVLMPGLVGLVAVDCLATGVPLVTLSDSRHSPEIEYLRDGPAHLLWEVDGPDELVDAAISVLEGQPRPPSSSGRAAPALDAMVEAFTAGVLDALSRERSSCWTGARRQAISRPASP